MVADEVSVYESQYSTCYMGYLLLSVLRIRIRDPGLGAF